MKIVSTTELEAYSPRVRKDIIDLKIAPLLQKGTVILEIDVDCSEGTIYNLKQRQPTWTFTNLEKDGKKFVGIALFEIVEKKASQPTSTK